MTDYRGGSGPDLQIGQAVGEYIIEGIAGVGAMGTVYAARDAAGDRIALKVASNECTYDERFRARFEQEAEIAREVRNPHLVPVLAIGEQDGHPYMAKPFIEGCSLEARLELLGPLEIDHTIGICCQVSDALEALWEAGMVHRDVKPANILLETGGQVYLTDFGLAKNTNGSTLTRPGETMGSLPYMSPEQIRSEPVTEAADIYSLACVVFECLTGNPPFGKKPAMKVLWSQLSDEPPDPSTLRDELASEFSAALLAALAKDALERPATAREFADSLALAHRAASAAG